MFDITDSQKVNLLLEVIATAENLLLAGHTNAAIAHLRVARIDILEGS